MLPYWNSVIIPLVQSKAMERSKIAKEYREILYYSKKRIIEENAAIQRQNLDKEKHLNGLSPLDFSAQQSLIGNRYRPGEEKRLRSDIEINAGLYKPTPAIPTHEYPSENKIYNLLLEIPENKDSENLSYVNLHFSGQP